LKYIVMSIVLLGSMLSSAAYADNCGSIIAGANTQGYSGPYGGYDADGRCHARDVSEGECRRLAGGLFYGWSADRGKGFTHCVFSQPSGSSAPRQRERTYEPPAYTPAPTYVPKPYVDTDAARYQIKLCNYSSTPLIYAAIVTSEDPAGGQWVIRGWWQIPRNGCKHVATRNFGSYGSHSFYVYGNATKGNRKTEWPKPDQADTRYCVSNSAYARLQTSNYRCRGKEYIAGFAERKVARDGDGLTTATVNFKDD
jgi:uncharacterized membrane protein